MYNIKEMIYVSNQRKIFMKFSVYGALLFLAVTIALTPHFFYKKHPLSPSLVKFPTDLKYILFWKGKEKTGFPNKEWDTLFATGQTLFIKQKCQNINCYITYNRTLLQYDWYFDAIVFDIRAIRHNKVSDFNLTRADYQKYIFRALESTQGRPVCNNFYDDFFNLTWTYKLNSDIPHPFLDIYDLNNTFVGPAMNVTWLEYFKHTDRFAKKVKHKTKAIAWVVESCKLKLTHQDFYESLVKELKGYNYSIDLYGSCGENKCPNGALYKCYKMIEKNYFFQLVFEDSIAEDFVTEKLVKVMQLSLVPIVLGGADYNRFLPPGTYINSQGFNMKKLGAIIDYLIRNPETYSFFLDWKNHYVYSLRPKNYVCDLCAKLNDPDQNTDGIKRFRKWWNPDYKEICMREHLYKKFAKESF
ncbi:alpha-(1,3)-fucosyltransferase C-like [Pectinophora gossypiella]|uniref:alpha-(1,3)-fucosyltransferase C-like n=1 Tax=Pectinophora gossypiella TaxID=13191 RepID=UPI00214E2CB8|nr:alpha-(1,3)-fucosyltransferase C-like [Pectinophora gossypiella]